MRIKGKKRKKNQAIREEHLLVAMAEKTKLSVC